MLRIIIILIWIASFINSVSAQTEFDKQLLAIEQHVFESKNDTVKASLCLQKFNLYVSTNNYYSAAALNEVKRIDFLLLSDSAKEKFLWNAGLLFYLHKEQRSAMYYIQQYKSLSKDSSMNCFLLELLSAANYDTLSVSTILKKASIKTVDFTCLNCLNEIVVYQRKGENRYLFASAIVPGLGSAINGNVGKGFVSLSLNSLIAYVMYYMLHENLYLNAFGWGLSFGIKFYTGNLRLTEKLFFEKEAKTKNKLAKNCELKLKEVLNKYPLLFK